jgi:hypothetical protein
LNSVISSGGVELKVRQTLGSKLKELRNLNKALYLESSWVLYTYETSRQGGINRKVLTFKNCKEASIALDLPVSGIFRYRNTYIPYRNKLFFS